MTPGGGAEGLNLLAFARTEPRSLGLAMADPSDLNSIDSARFASGLNIEPVVVSHSTLKHALVEQYRKLDSLPAHPEVPSNSSTQGLPVALGLPVPLESMVIHHAEPGKYSRDPFFDEMPVTEELPPPVNPFTFFTGDATSTAESPVPPVRAAGGDSPMIIHSRSAGGSQAKRLDSYQTRTLVLGLIKMFQRRGILGEDELQRFITNLIEAGELKDDESNPRSTGSGPVANSF